MTNSADDIATTLVKWTGRDYRWVVGVMFSGLYGTSWGDSMYVDLVVRCLFYHIEDFLVAQCKPDLLQAFLNHPKKCRIYGDNILISMPWEVLKLVTVPIGNSDDVSYLKFGVIEGHFRDRWGMTIKQDETFVHGSGEFFTRVANKRCGGNTYDTVIVGKPGVNYLKRYFLEVEVPRNGGPGIKRIAMPFRDTIDYFSKSITAVSRPEHYLTYVSRWIGLLVDSAGTNLAAWDYLNFLIDEMYKARGNPDPELTEIMKIDELWRDPELKKRMMKMGYSEENWIPIYDRSKLASQFAPPKYAHNF